MERFPDHESCDKAVDDDGAGPNPLPESFASGPG